MAKPKHAQCCAMCGRPTADAAAAFAELEKSARKRLKKLPPDVTFITLRELADVLMVSQPTTAMQHALRRTLIACGWKLTKQRRPYSQDFHIGYARPSTTTAKA